MTYTIGEIFDDYPSKEIRMEINNDCIAHIEEYEGNKWIIVKNAQYVPTARDKISELKHQLRATDYQAIKYAEGELSAEEYAPIKQQRKEWRAQINELEKEITG